IRHRSAGWKSLDTGRPGNQRSRGLVVAHIFQKRSGWRKEQTAGDSAAEIQQSVIVAGRPANEHILEHLLDGSRRPAVTDEVGAELASRPTERHVVAEDFELLAVLYDRGEGIVC